MKRCITQRALCVLLAVMLTISVFATCLVFSATADTTDALPIDNYGDFVASTITVLNRIGDAKTIGEASKATTGDAKDYNYHYLVACNKDGKVVTVIQTLSRPNGNKDSFEIPEGGFVLLCHGAAGGNVTEAVLNAFKAIKVGDTVTLNGVDLAALATAGTKANLTGATFTVSSPANLLKGIKYTSEGAKRTDNCGDTNTDGTCKYRLTDGVITNDAGSNQVGAYGAGNVTFTFDLGEVKTMSSFHCVGYSGDWGIGAPNSVEFLVSDDGTTYTSVGVVAATADNTSALAGSWVKHDFLLNTPASGKFVKAIYRTGSHTWLSEIEAFAADSIEDIDTTGMTYVDGETNGTWQTALNPTDPNAAKGDM